MGGTWVPEWSHGVETSALDHLPPRDTQERKKWVHFTSDVEAKLIL